MNIRIYWLHLLPSPSKKRNRHTYRHTTPFNQILSQILKAPSYTHPPTLWTLDFSKGCFPVSAHSLYWQGWLRGAPIPLDCSHLPVHLPCPSLGSSQHHEDKAQTATLMGHPHIPCLVSQGKEWEGGKQLLNIFCADSTLQAVPLSPCPCTLQKECLRKCCPDCQRHRNFQRHWKRGKQRGKREKKGVWGFE